MELPRGAVGRELGRRHGLQGAADQRVAHEAHRDPDNERSPQRIHELAERQHERLQEDQEGAQQKRRTEAQLEAMQAALTSFQESIEADSDAVPSDFAFHMEVARATANPHFADLMTYLGTMIIPRTRVGTLQQTSEGRLVYLQRVHSEHESILNAIRQQDAESARAAMRTHLSNSRERLRRAQHSG